jgi:hypothetical protein
MTSIGSAVISAGLRRLVTATLFTAAVAVGSSAFGYVAIARADWDIEAYDNCLKTVTKPDGPDSGDIHACCIDSGGDFHNNKCWAPVELTGPQGGTTPTTLRPVMTPVMPPPTEALP